VTDPSTSYVSMSGIVASVYLKTYRCAELPVPEDKERQQGKNLQSIVDSHWGYSVREVLR